jgi:hypothetical protein
MITTPRLSGWKIPRKNSYERCGRYRHQPPGAFSGGVSAIIVTFMVLKRKAPEQGTLSALTALWPIFFSYTLSFLIVAIIGSTTGTSCVSRLG